MKYRIALFYVKSNFHHGIEAVDFLRVMVASGIENQAVEPGTQILVLREQLGAAPLRIR
jgi:hypothetical protein